MSCRACNGETPWDDDVGSSVCTSCGTLVDASQSVLASHLDIPDTSGRDHSSFWLPSNTLKSVVRGRSAWDLAGQGKEARDAKNTQAIHNFIRSLAFSLSASPFIHRATSIFSVVMARGHYRWGRRAKLAAGSALALALREAKRPDVLRDIAFLLDEPSIAVRRAFTAALQLSALQLPTADPVQHLPMLIAHLSTLLDPTAPAPPCTLNPVIASLSLHNVSRTADALAALLSRLPAHALTDLPTPPTACALILLALEAESRAPLPHLGPLAAALGARVAVSQVIVMQRYKATQDLLAECVKEVPWFSGGKAKGKRGTSKRAVVAKGVMDVLTFQEEIWRRKMEACGRPRVELEEDEGDEQVESDGDEEALKGPQAAWIDLRPCKKQKITPIDKASQFLLDPLSATVSESRIFTSEKSSCSVTPSCPSTPRRATSTPPLYLPSFLLTASPSAISLKRVPTRLQLLSTTRGGEADISDEELFGEHEWEEIIRDEEERGVVWRLHGESWEECERERAARSPQRKGGEGSQRKKRKRAGVDDEPCKGSSRVDLDALARILGSTSDCGDKGDHHVLLEDEKEDYLYDEDLGMAVLTMHDAAEEILGEELSEWRSLSPDRGWEGRYDEEC